MARPKRVRKMLNPPAFKGYKPFGMAVSEKELVLLHLEELEVIRLLDYENLTQLEASRLMEISRPTLTRIYTSARQKVAKAFAEAKTLIVEGGKVSFNNNWHRCTDCQSLFNVHGNFSEIICPLCGGGVTVTLSDSDNLYDKKI